MAFPIIRPPHKEIVKDDIVVTDEHTIREMKEKLALYEKRYGQIYVGKSKWKNLFKKPNYYEWTILVLIILALLTAWAYYHDIKTCRDFIANNNTYTINPNLINITDTSNVTFKENSNITDNPG